MESNDTLDQRIQSATYVRDSAWGQLDISVKAIGMTRAYYGQDPQQELMVAIQRYVEAVARLEVLNILSTEDFFVAMARSAGALQTSPNP